MIFVFNRTGADDELSLLVTDGLVTLESYYPDRIVSLYTLAGTIAVQLAVALSTSGMKQRRPLAAHRTSSEDYTENEHPRQPILNSSETSVSLLTFAFSTDIRSLRSSSNFSNHMLVDASILRDSYHARDLA